MTTSPQCLTTTQRTSWSTASPSTCRCGTPLDRYSRSPSFLPTYLPCNPSLTCNSHSSFLPTSGRLCKVTAAELPANRRVPAVFLDHQPELSCKRHLDVVPRA